MKQLLVLALIGSCVCSTTVAMQTPQQKEKKDPEDVVKISVTLVQLDAVVTDQKGRLVTDLKKEDFELLEDGKRQHITSFEFISTESSSPEHPVVKPATINASPVPPPRLKADQVKRTIALVVDDLSLSLESSVFTRDALKKFVDEQMQPGDLVAIIRAGAGIGALQQFTADKRLLHAAADRVRFNPNGRGMVGAFAPINGNREGLPLPLDSDSNPEADMEAARARTFSVGTLGALRFVIRGLSQLPGRKSAVLFSDGFRLFGQGRDNYRVLDSMRYLTDEANRASVVVYTVDPRGIPYTGLTAADSLPRGGAIQVMRQVGITRSRTLYATQEGLNYLARETGGLAIRNTNDITGGLQRVLDDQRGYYLLGYVPEDDTFRREGGRRPYHSLKVTVKKSGLNVRSRGGFFAVPDADREAQRSLTSNKIVAALTSPFATGDINVRLTSLFGNTAEEGSSVRSILHIDARDLSFVEEADGWQKAEFDIVAFTFGDNGQVVDHISKRFTLGAKGETFDQIKRDGIIYTLNLPVTQPGAYQLRTAVLDVATQRLGSANQFIEVPDVEKSRLLLSGLVVSEQNREKAAASNVADGKEGQIVGRQASPGHRVLKAGSTVQYEFVIYNAKLDTATNAPKLETQVRLLKDGKETYTGQVKPFKVLQTSDLKRIAAGGALRLGPELVPGEYVLQVIVRDGLAREKQNTVHQWIDLEIVK